MEKSWAKVFSDEIFPAIDEERFRVLYSQNASRPNTPVNIIVGALIIKELFALSDDEIVENLMLDIHYQYALHTTSYEEQPLSDKSLSRFRKRCYEYEKTTGVDLFHECVCDLNRKIAKLMGINSHIKRMDSLMIEANIRKLSRIELLYSCVARLAKRIEKKEGIGKLTGLEHYCQPGDRNFIVYHCRKRCGPASAAECGTISGNRGVSSACPMPGRADHCRKRRKTASQEGRGIPVNNFPAKSY